MFDSIQKSLIHKIDFIVMCLNIIINVSKTKLVDHRNQMRAMTIHNVQTIFICLWPQQQLQCQMVVSFLPSVAILLYFYDYHTFGAI